MAMMMQEAVGYTALDPIIVHLSKLEDEAAHRAAMQDADLILAQRTSDDFPIPHLRSQTVRDSYGDRVVIWPNLFFAGQQPYLRYLTHTQFGRIHSPLGDYHDLRHLRAWFENRQGVDFLKRITEADYVTDYTNRSLADLHQREADCDVGIADLVTDYHAQQALFFTFNHPRIWLLGKLGERILDKIGQAAPIKTDSMREPLNRIQPPNGLTDKELQGVTVTLEADEKIVMGGLRAYKGEELQRIVFECYDHVAPHMTPDQLRLTPAL